MSCEGVTKKGDQCKVKVKEGEEFCWRHNPNYKPKKSSRKTKKQWETEIIELKEKINYLNAMIDGMKMMIIK